MKKNWPVVAYGLIYLFIIQLVGTLVASIYTLDLLHTSLDANALGVLFVFAPIVFNYRKKNIPKWLLWFLFGILAVARGTIPFLNTNPRMLVSGIGTAASLCIFLVLITYKPRFESEWPVGYFSAGGMALAICLSAMLRTINSGIDYSLSIDGIWFVWIMLGFLGYALSGFKPGEIEVSPSEKGKTSLIFGIFMILTLVYFIFSAPAVIARWTEANYAVVIISTILISLAWIILLSKPGWLKWITARVLIWWNILFSISLVGTILAHRVNFPPTPDSFPVLVGSPTPIQQVPLFLLLLLFPVIFIDLQFLVGKLQSMGTQPKQLVPGFLLGSFSLILLVFMKIFTNVWGYVEPVSPFFRNKFWLPFLLICINLTIAMKMHLKGKTLNKVIPNMHPSRIWMVVGMIILIISVAGIYQWRKPNPAGKENSSLKVMTYNIQQGNDQQGEQSLLRQLEVIQKVDPDVLAIQEMDSTRISLNNVDIVRFFVDRLGYYSYYGPNTITGSFGTAILSKYPLSNTHTIYTFSDQDENATAVAQIEVNSRVFNIFNVHPDGSDKAMNAFARMIQDTTTDLSNVIVMGDFNLRDYEDGYRMINSVLINSWVFVYPTEIGKNGLDMSGDNRIDHIFISDDIQVKDPEYLLPPDSATDHPVHWATITWDD